MIKIDKKVLNFSNHNDYSHAKSDQFYKSTFALEITSKYPRIISCIISHLLVYYFRSW